ncbi:MAG: B12-binding domain-containing radical SAM protein [Nitrospirae bacterium]|nr:B12-binding domain-containing radical SAM protein [Nitrospirota bacterium]
MAKIYLINPKCPDTFWGLRYGQQLQGRRYSLPNLALPTLAALVPPEHEVVCCDENVEEVALDTNADIIGITGYNLQVARMIELATEFRKRGKLVLIGGPYATLDPDSLRPYADVFFLGEAEYTFPQFWKDYASGSWSSIYEQKESVSMDHTPVPRWDTVPLQSYGVGAIQTTRGCPFDCEFCDIIVLHGHKVRRKPVDQVITELQMLSDRQVESFFITDDNFIGDRKYAKAVLREIVELQTRVRKPLTFMTQVTINLAYDEELMNLMARAGFHRVFIGIETPRKASLRETNKTQNTGGNLVDHISKIQSYGIVVWAGMIVGFDNDDATIFDEQVDFIQQAGLTVVMAGMLQAPHGTPLRARLQREGRLREEGSSLMNNCSATNIIPKQMTLEQLYDGYRTLLERIYEPGAYFDRMRQFVDRARVSLSPYKKRFSERFAGHNLRTVWSTAVFFLTHRERKVRQLFWRTVGLARGLRGGMREEIFMHLGAYRHFDLYVRRRLIPQLHWEDVAEKLSLPAAAVPLPLPQESAATGT